MYNKIITIPHPYFDHRVCTASEAQRESEKLQAEEVSKLNQLNGSPDAVHAINLQAPLLNGYANSEQ